MEQIDPFLPELFSPEDAAKELGLSTQHVGRLCRAGKIIAQQVGGRWIITRPALEAFKKEPKNGRGNPDFGTKYKGRSKSSD